MQVRQRYTKEFKLEAVGQLEEGIKPAAVVARELGVRRNQLYKWKNEVADKGSEAAFKGPGRRLSSANWGSGLAIRQNKDAITPVLSITIAAIYFHDAVTLPHQSSLVQWAFDLFVVASHSINA